jgi:hypothetical protein
MILAWKGLKPLSLTWWSDTSLSFSSRSVSISLRQVSSWYSKSRLLDSAHSTLSANFACSSCSHKPQNTSWNHVLYICQKPTASWAWWRMHYTRDSNALESATLSCTSPWSLKWETRLHTYFHWCISIICGVREIVLNIQGNYSQRI